MMLITEQVAAMEARVAELERQRGSAMMPHSADVVIDTINYHTIAEDGSLLISCATTDRKTLFVRLTSGERVSIVVQPEAVSATESQS
jgi:N-acetylglutamate synthase-like GNAT family acetyltransferase